MQAVFRANGFNIRTLELFSLQRGQTVNGVTGMIWVTGGQSCVKTLTMATGYPVHNEPPDIQHGSVMVDVKKGDLMVVLSENEEKGVHELNELGEIVPPQDIYDLRSHTAEQKRLKI